MSIVNDWSKIKAVIFDVDGTLYDQSKLRKLMMKDLLKYYSLRPHRYKEIKVISSFRKFREVNAELEVSDLDTAQYMWVANMLNIDAEKVKSLVEKWMHREPLKYLKQIRYPNVLEFILLLKSQEIQIAIFSDFPAQEKMRAMEMPFDIAVSSTDKDINKLKPNPEGLNYIMQKLNLRPEECLFIGDRDERDGEAARRAGMEYYIVPHRKNCFEPLLNDLDSYIDKL